MTNTIEKPRTESEKLFSDLDKPSLHALSYALRHPDTWPEGFTWNFSYCSQCAMGLAGKLWDLHISGDHGGKQALSQIARTFAMPYAEANSIFLGAGGWAPTITQRAFFRRKEIYDFDAVTPEMVADQIDAYLARAE